MQLLGNVLTMEVPALKKSSVSDDFFEKNVFSFLLKIATNIALSDPKNLVTGSTQEHAPDRTASLYGTTTFKK